jgi:hypothetical protein
LAISTGTVIVILVLLIVAMMISIRDHISMVDSIAMDKLIPKRFSLSQYHTNSAKPNELNIMSCMTIDNMFDPKKIIKNNFKIGTDKSAFERCSSVLLDDIAMSIISTKKLYVDNGFDNIINVTIIILSYQYSIIAKAIYNLEANDLKYTDVNGYNTIDVFDEIIDCASKATESLHKGDDNNNV